MDGTLPGAGSGVRTAVADGAGSGVCPVAADGAGRSRTASAASAREVRRSRSEERRGRGDRW